MNYNEKIVLVGGGGGVYQIGRYLKHKRPNITTVQTAFDAGGHSGRLRDERGVLPPGDLRQAILALVDDSKQSLIRRVLSHRFSPKNGSSIDGVSLGNLLLTALIEINNGNVPAGIAQLSEIAGVPEHIKILPVSLDDANLVVTFDDGTTMQGEGLIDTRHPSDKRRIVSADLTPSAHIYVAAYKALVEANKIVFCPGDFWTSLIPNTRVKGFWEAMQEATAQTIMVTNIMTKKSETDGFEASTFASTLCNHIGRPLDVVLCNVGKIPDSVAESYAKEESFPVKTDLEIYAKKVVTGDFVSVTGGIIRHHKRVTSAIAEL